MGLIIHGTWTSITVNIDQNSAFEIFYAVFSSLIDSGEIRLKKINLNCYYWAAPVLHLYSGIYGELRWTNDRRCLPNDVFWRLRETIRNVSRNIASIYVILRCKDHQILFNAPQTIYSVRRLMGSLWANIKVVTITEWFN